jgi:hypothetical protein
MKIVVKKGKKEVTGKKEFTTAAVTAEGLPPSDVSKTVQPGFEDIILLIVMAVLITGYARGQLTIQEFLTYLGVTGAGGLWGMLGGTSSSKT